MGYDHFDRKVDGKVKCVLHENDNTRLETKIKTAQTDAVKRVLEEEEDLAAEDLKVEVPNFQPKYPQPPGMVNIGQLPNFHQQFYPPAPQGFVNMAPMQLPIAVPLQAQPIQVDKFCKIPNIRTLGGFLPFQIVMSISLHGFPSIHRGR
jgi:hypothetical protein